MWSTVAGGICRLNSRPAYVQFAPRYSQWDCQRREWALKRVIGATVFAAFGALAPLPLSAGEEDIKLPPEVTPQLRAACEKDVRRLCIGTNPTISKVKVCVASKFLQLGRRCQIQLALSGFKH